MPITSLGFAQLDGFDNFNFGDSISLAATTLADAELAAFRKDNALGPSVMQVLQDGRVMLPRMYVF